MTTKRITKSGTITLPKELRAQLGIPLGSAVDIDTDGEYIIIRKHIPICFFCRSAEHITKVMGTEICSNCAKKIYLQAGAKK